MMNIYNTSNVLANIRKIRITKGYSQEYLASKIGIGQNVYSKIELGHIRLTLIHLFIISELFEIDPPDLLAMDRQDPALPAPGRKFSM